MYAISKGSNKIVAKTRRAGLSTQKFDSSFDSSRDFPKKKVDSEQEVEMSSPKPVFHPVINGRKANNLHAQPEVITPQHEEIIKYVHNSWNKVCAEYEQAKQSSTDRGLPAVFYYQDKEPHPMLQDFQPFDLENWWGKRMYANIIQST